MKISDIPKAETLAKQRAVQILKLRGFVGSGSIQVSGRDDDIEVSRYNKTQAALFVALVDLIGKFYLDEIRTIEARMAEIGLEFEPFEMPELMPFEPSEPTQAPGP